MEPLDLTVPRQHDFSDPTVERDEARLGEWLTNLPLMDVVETVRLVLGALRAMNEQKLEIGQRFRFLEIYRETARRLLVTVDPLHLRQLALTRSQKEEATTGVEQLLLDIAAGYKLIVVSLHEQAVAGKPSGLLGHAINRAIELLGLALLESYRFYRTADTGIVAEINQLYRAARYHGQLGAAVAPDEEENDGEPAATVADLYHAHLLLSLTDPFRLAEGEAGLIADVINQHAALCRIVPGQETPQEKAGMFWVDLHGRDAPVSCLQQDTAGDIRDPYLLDTRRALAAVREALAKTPETVREQSPEALLLRRLLPQQSGADDRREQRHPESRRVNVVAGLERIHGYLGVAAGAGSLLSACRLLDASGNGMCLAWDNSTGIDVRVGELFGIVADDARPGRLQLAVARSVRVFREGGMELGMELLPGGAGPVVCRQPGNDSGVMVRALFMPANEAAGVGASLVVPAGLYDKGARLEIDVSGRRVPVRMGECLLDGPVFQRFEYVADRA